MTKVYKIIMYDGTCLLCNSFVRFIVNRDKQDVFRFKTLQASEVSEDNGRFDSVCLLDNGKDYYKSEAVIRILYRLNIWWRPVILLLIVPRFIRNFIYSLVAKNRYRMFGKADHCIVPDESIKYKFINNFKR